MGPMHRWGVPFAIGHAVAALVFAARVFAARLFAALALAGAAAVPGALAQSVAPRPPSPIIQGAPTLPPQVDPAQRAYADCVRQKHDEMVLYGQATQVRDLVDHRERFAEALRANPQSASRYPGGVDQAIQEAFRHYRAAGGTAATPQAVQPGEPPCPPPVIVPPGSNAARALQPTPAPVREAELRLENCVVRNRATHDLWQASVRVSVTLERRDEMRKVGERMNWGGATRENFQRSERDVAESFARYQSLGGNARVPEDVARGEEPCRDERRQLDAATRAAYPGGSSPITQSRSMSVPSGASPAATGSVMVPPASGSVTVPPSTATPR